VLPDTLKMKKGRHWRSLLEIENRQIRKLTANILGFNGQAVFRDDYLSDLAARRLPPDRFQGVAEELGSVTCGYYNGHHREAEQLKGSLVNTLYAEQIGRVIAVPFPEPRRRVKGLLARIK